MNNPSNLLITSFSCASLLISPTTLNCLCENISMDFERASYALSTPCSEIIWLIGSNMTQSPSGSCLKRSANSSVWFNGRVTIPLLSLISLAVADSSTNFIAPISTRSCSLLLYSDILGSFETKTAFRHSPNIRSVISITASSYRLSGVYSISTDLPKRLLNSSASGTDHTIPSMRNSPTYSFGMVRNARCIRKPAPANALV